MYKALGYFTVSSALYVKKWYNGVRSFAVCDFCDKVGFSSCNVRC
ncbi:hypothetical protein ACTPC6_04005 [Clostridioides difficile]